MGLGSRRRPRIRDDAAIRCRREGFYYLDVYGAQGHDPLTMEKQFATLERDVARITDQWLGWIRAGEPGKQIEIPEPNRDLVALFVSLQFLRTADTRDILARLASTASDPEPSKAERRRLLSIYRNRTGRDTLLLHRRHTPSV